MDTMDIFNQDAFGLISMTDSALDMPYVPGVVGQSGIFTSKPVTTTTIMIEKKGTTLGLIQTSPRGAPPEKKVRDKRNVRNLNIPRIAKDVEIYAEQVQGVRAFGSTSTLEQVQQVVNDEVGIVLVENDMTIENLRLGAIKGIILDADGSTLYNLFTEFSVTQIAEFDFELDDTAIDVRVKCQALKRLMGVEIKSGAMPFGIEALVGDEFFDALISHTSVKATYLNRAGAEKVQENVAWESFYFAGINFVNYRSTDDGTSIVVDTTKAHFYPIGVPGLFVEYYAPADTIDTVNTPGLPRYILPGRDPSGKNRYVTFEVQSNPLPICLKPRVLIKAKKF
jgi:hypothetical protein